MVIIDKDVDILSSRAFDILQEEKPDAVYYLAGPMELRSGAGEAELKSWQERYRGLESVFKAIASMRARLVLVSSGGAIYASPGSAYAKANLFLEAMLEKSGTNHVVVRFSNIYGPGQWKEGVVPSIISNILHDQPVIIGGDGNQTRDFLYVDDAVSALMETAMSKEKGIFDVGSGKETRINEIVVEVENLLEKKADKEYRDLPGAKKSVVNPGKFQHAFNWRASVSLKNGLQKTIEYYKHAGIK